jgi:hypothetical protein
MTAQSPAAYHLPPTTSPRRRSSGSLPCLSVNIKPSEGAAAAAAAFDLELREQIQSLIASRKQKESVKFSPSDAAPPGGTDISAIHWKSAELQIIQEIQTMQQFS